MLAIGRGHARKIGDFVPAKPDFPVLGMLLVQRRLAVVFVKVEATWDLSVLRFNASRRARPESQLIQAARL
jgi:hypothetical protein